MNVFHVKKQLQLNVKITIFVNKALINKHVQQFQLKSFVIQNNKF